MKKFVAAVLLCGVSSAALAGFVDEPDRTPQIEACKDRADDAFDACMKPASEQGFGAMDKCQRAKDRADAACVTRVEVTGTPTPAPSPAGRAATSALADTMTCSDAHTNWFVTIDGPNATIRQDQPNSPIRHGTYHLGQGYTTLNLEDLRIDLNSTGVGRWKVGTVSGDITCHDTTLFTATAPASNDDPNRPGVEHVISLPSQSAPVVAAVTNHVPITITDRSARVLVSVGSTAITMLIDTGATSMSLTQSVADRLVSSGQATEGPPTIVTYADGRKIDGRSVNVTTVTIGGHVLHNVHAGVENDGAEPLLGFDALSHITGKFAINTNTSTLDLD